MSCVSEQVVTLEQEQAHTVIEHESRAIASDASGVVEAAMMAHCEWNNGQPAYFMLLHHVQRAPIELRDGSWCGA